MEDRFWSARQRTNRLQSLPHAHAQLAETGRLAAFALGWRPGQEPVPHYFWDSDVAKWVEAASYALATDPDPELGARLGEVVRAIVGAQQPDGYLNVYFSTVEPGAHWQDLRDAHELYCAGHLIEAAVAHHQATGERVLLDAACRLADHIGRVFGLGPGQIPGYSGHEEVELALVRLYRATGEERYLAQARYFVDQRGQSPNYFEVEAARRGTPGHAEGFMRSLRHPARHNQSHAPVRQQSEAVGHAVRAMYLYSAMTDLAVETGDEELAAACRRLFADVTGRHMYITGGVGSSAANEGFTEDWDLPNASAYAETCASVGLAFWAHRMLELEPRGEYGDVLERVLYNGVLAGVSADGTRFFYANPLASRGDVHRQEWFGCACCPPNAARIVASLGQYVYAAGPGTLAVHLYVQGQAEVDLDGQRVVIRQRTDYPWDGSVELTLEPEKPARFELLLRLPGWCRAPRLEVQGQTVDVGAVARDGYAWLDRTWRAGERVRLVLPMPPERIWAHPQVREDQGCAALQRGPLIFCLEEVDNPGIPLGRVSLVAGADIVAEWSADLLGGVVSLQTLGRVARGDDWGGALYRPAPPRAAGALLRAVPYFAWDNRAQGAMRVWLPEG